MYVPTDRVIDVDLTVDQAVWAILTSGIATEDEDMPGQDHNPSDWKQCHHR